MDHIKVQLRNWIAEKRRSVDVEDIRDDTPLLEVGLLKSIDITDPILFIEFVRDEPIRITDLKPGVFASINSIVEQFFAMERS